MKNILIVCSICLLLFSCKKDKLEGDKSILIVKWDWITTNHNYGFCDNDSNTETITPDYEGNNYSMEFSKKGIVQYYENNLLIDKDRLVYDDFITSFGTFFRS